MTREEAAEFTRKLVARAETIVFPKTPKTINNIPVFYFEAVLSALRGPQPDPITGLVPCGCGGEVYPHYQLGWCHEESGVQAFEVSTGCDGCGTYTKPRRGHYANGIDEDDTESASKRDWNISHGYTAPPLPGAIGPDAGETAPNGDEGAEL